MTLSLVSSCQGFFQRDLQWAGLVSEGSRAAKGGAAICLLQTLSLPLLPSAQPQGGWHSNI